jgi:hypothetical protein
MTRFWKLIYHSREEVCHYIIHDRVLHKDLYLNSPSEPSVVGHICNVPAIWEAGLGGLMFQVHLGKKLVRSHLK